MGSSRLVERTHRGPEARLNHRPEPAPDRPALTHLFETRVLPQLIKDHDTTDCVLLPAPEPGLDVPQFTEAILAVDSVESMEFFQALVHRGMAVDMLFERLLVPAALCLGSMWERDARDFLDVTRGMDHIQQIILAHSSKFCTEQKQNDKQHSVLLVTLPQERHRLGLCLVRADFWRAGWNVSCGELNFMNDLETLVKASSYDAVGISAGRVGDAAMLARSLDRVRRASSNPALMIITGGYAFQRDPALSTAIGADFSAQSGRDAVAKLQNRLNVRTAASKR